MLGKARPLRAGAGPLTVQGQEARRDFPDHRASAEHPSILSAPSSLMALSPWPLLDCWVSGAWDPERCRSWKPAPRPGFCGDMSSRTSPPAPVLPNVQRQKRSVTPSRVGGCPLQIMCRGRSGTPPQVSLNGDGLVARHTSPQGTMGPVQRPTQYVLCCKFNYCEREKKEKRKLLHLKG